MDVANDYRHIIARRAAREVKDGMTVNLGIGIPTLVADYLAPGVNVMVHAECGVLGCGPGPAPGEENPMLCNAGGFPITVASGASYFDSAMAFAVIRRGLLDMTILGALEVSSRGDLANWIIPGKRIPGPGGAIDLAQKSKKVMVVTAHCNKDGAPKIVENCRLPLTASGCVDLIVTEMAVMEVKADGLYLVDIHEHYNIEQVLAATGTSLKLPQQLGSFC